MFEKPKQIDFKFGQQRRCRKTYLSALGEAIQQKKMFLILYAKFKYVLTKKV